MKGRGELNGEMRFGDGRSVVGKIANLVMEYESY